MNYYALVLIGPDNAGETMMRADHEATPGFFAARGYNTTTYSDADSDPTNNVTAARINNWINSLSLVCVDRVLIFISTHGYSKSDNVHGKVHFRSFDLTGDQLKLMLDKIPACSGELCDTPDKSCHVTVMLDTCFAGSWLTAGGISGTGRTIMASSLASETSKGSQTKGGAYSVAFRECSLAAGGKPAGADADGDGNVTPKEAHEWVRPRLKRQTVPAASDGECPCFCPIQPPDDPLYTPDDFTAPPTFTSFGFGSNPPLPPGFFGPGSDPFFGTVNPFTGIPTDRDQYGTANTLVRRRTNPISPFVPPPANATVPIELVALNLVSVNPITVSYNGGTFFEPWYVGITTTTTAPEGSMNVTKTHPNGGVFDTQLLVQPVFTFMRANNPHDIRVLDTGFLGLPPVQFQSFGAQWVHQAFPGLGLIAPSNGQFVPGVAETMPGNPASQIVVPFSLFDPSTNTQHTVCPARPQEVCPLVFETPLDPCFEHQADCVGTGFCFPATWTPEFFVTQCGCTEDPYGPADSSCGPLDATQSGLLQCTTSEGGCRIHLSGSPTNSPWIATSSVPPGNTVTCAVADLDLDGVGDGVDNCPTFNPGQQDQDGDGTGDACDLCPTDYLKVTPGECGCGVSDSDYDGDGLIYCNDPCPLDPLNNCSTVACFMNSQCASFDDNNSCTCVTCHVGLGFCVPDPVSFGNVNCMGPSNANLDDILCVLQGFANFASCFNGDIAPCGGNNVINLDDILFVLNAFAGGNPCGCP